MPGSKQPTPPLAPPHRPVDRRLQEEFGIFPTVDKPVMPASDRRFERGIDSISAPVGQAVLEGFDGYL